MQAQERIEGLCTWRAALMLGGLATHATMNLEQLPAMALIANLSHAFRMGVFFTISGLLSGFALQRRAVPERWLRERVIQIGIPTAFGMIVVGPLIGLLRNTHRLPDSAVPVPGDWYHIWFLAALFLYAPLAYAIHVLDRRYGLVARIERPFDSDRSHQTLLIVGLGASTAVLFMVTTQIVTILAPEAYRPAMLQWRLIVGYAPLFALGVVVSRSVMLRQILIAPTYTPVVILSITALVYLAWYGWFVNMTGPAQASRIDTTLTTLGAAFCPPAAASLILRSAIRVRHVPDMIRRLSDASFTMYILHYPVIVATKLVLTQVRPDIDPWIDFALSIATSGISSYAFHRVVVRRSAFASLLLNGRHHCAIAAERATAARLASVRAMS